MDHKLVLSCTKKFPELVRLQLTERVTQSTTDRFVEIVHQMMKQRIYPQRTVCLCNTSLLDGQCTYPEHTAQCRLFLYLLFSHFYHSAPRELLKQIQPTDHIELAPKLFEAFVALWKREHNKVIEGGYWDVCTRIYTNTEPEEEDEKSDLIKVATIQSEEGTKQNSRCDIM